LSHPETCSGDQSNISLLATMFCSFSCRARRLRFDRNTLAERTPNLMQRLSRLPTASQVALLHRRKSKPFTLPQAMPALNRRREDFMRGNLVQRYRPSTKNLIELELSFLAVTSDKRCQITAADR
jgi:hypothetical protein